MPDHYEARSSFLKNQMYDLVAKGQLKANPLKKLEGGLESILEGMKVIPNLCDNVRANIIGSTWKLERQRGRNWCTPSKHLL